MALRTYKPTSAGVRHAVKTDKKKLAANAPHKSLLATTKSKAGRNNTGKITVRHQGGGVKRKYRLIDFKRDKFNIPAVVESIEYDPNRTVFIALLKYADGERRYIIAPEELNVGDELVSGSDTVPFKPGNAMPVGKIAQGTMVHAVEMWPGQGAIMGRSAGSAIQVMGGDKGYVQLKLPSGEIRLVKDTCIATLGIASNTDHRNEKVGKAGTARRKGRRPTVRGVAMSYKHPHGAGQGKKGKATIGGPAKDFWGNKVGKRTRKHRKVTSKFIVRRRPNTNKFKKYKTIIDSNN